MQGGPPTTPNRSVAVCIPVRNDARGLEVTLASLGSERDGHPLSIRVVIDGHDPDCERVAARFGATVINLPCPRGSYAARAAGISDLPAGVEHILFTDAGCEVLPGWVEGHLRALESADLSGGAVDVPVAASPKVAEFVDARRNLLQEHYVTNDGFAATCNLAVRRAVFDEVGFRTDMESGGDRDFCRRATAAGFRLVYTRDAAVRHGPRRTWRAVLSKARRQGRGVASMDERARPAEMPRPRFEIRLGRGHPAGRGASRVGWLLAVAILDYLRQRAFVRSAKADGGPNSAATGGIGSNE